MDIYFLISIYIAFKLDPKSPTEVRSYTLSKLIPDPQQLSIEHLQRRGSNNNNINNNDNTTPNNNRNTNSSNDNKEDDDSLKSSPPSFPKEGRMVEYVRKDGIAELSHIIATHSKEGHITLSFFSPRLLAVS